MWKKIGAAIVVVAVSFVAADYLALFGTREERVQEILHLRYRIVERGNLRPIEDVRVQCVRRRAESVCSQGKGAGEGSVELNFVVPKTVSRTLLFKKGDTVSFGDGQLHLVFIHPNYERLFLPLGMSDLLSLRDRDNVIELKPSE